jgi:hypothetical protein
MNLPRQVLTAALLGAGVWLTCSAVTQDKDAQAAMAEGMKRWQQACTPGQSHQALARLLGSWTTETIVSGMGGPDMKSEGTAEWRWLFDGRWIQQNWSGSMMGTPIKGQMTIGYDNFRQKYTMASVNDMETVLTTSEGDFDQSGNTLITYGKLDEPMTGEVGKMVKYVWRLEGADKVTFEVHDLAIGESNTKVITVVYTRKK